MSEKSFYPPAKPIPAGSVPGYGGSIPEGQSPLGGPDPGSSATVLDYLVPCAGGADELKNESWTDFASLADDERKR